MIHFNNATFKLLTFIMAVYLNMCLVTRTCQCDVCANHRLKTGKTHTNNAHRKQYIFHYVTQLQYRQLFGHFRMMDYNTEPRTLVLPRFRCRRMGLKELTN